MHLDYPFAGSRMLRDLLAGEGLHVGRLHVSTLMKRLVACVQNHYNLVHRADDALIDALAEQQIAYVPFFPLGGFKPVQSETLSAVAKEHSVSLMQLALAWLLARSPNILLIPETSSVAHLRENLDVASLSLPIEALSVLGERI